MRITYNTGLELILVFSPILLVIIKLSIDWKNECKNIGKTRFSRGFRECNLLAQCPLPLFLWLIWKEPLHFSINVFYQNPANPNSSLVVPLISVPPSPAARKPVLTTGFWSQAIDFSLQRPPELKLAVSISLRKSGFRL